MHPEAAVQTRACEADEGSEFGGGPLWGGGRAVAAGCVAGCFLKGEELCLGEGEGQVSWVTRVLVMERGGGLKVPCFWFRGRLPTLWSSFLSYSVLSSRLLHYAYGNDMLLLVNGYRGCYCVVVEPDPRSLLESKCEGGCT